MSLEENSKTAVAGSPNQPPEHEWRVSKDGQPFDVLADRWQLNARRAVKISVIRKLLPQSLRESAIWTLAHYAETMAGNSLPTITSVVRNFVRLAGTKIDGNGISIAIVASYRHFRLKRDGHDGQFSHFRSFLTRWFELGYPGVSRELVEEIGAWRLKSLESGAAVNSLDPNEGPLTSDELGSLQLLALTAFERGELPLEEFSLLRIMIATGRRPLQVAQTKLKDMDDSKFEDLEVGQEPRPLLQLKIPRVKTKSTNWRQRFRAVPLTTDLWNLLAMQRRAVCGRFDALLERTRIALPSEALQRLHGELPLFPLWPAVETSFEELEESFSREKSADAFRLLLQTAASDAWHHISKAVGETFNAIVSITQPASRNGSRLKLFPRRLRYTYQSRLEQAGCSPAVIAWNMDHSSVKSQVSYSKNGPDKARAISKTMALGLATFAKVFQGKVVANEESAEGGTNPAASRILVDATGGATCATLRGCGMNALPRPCYGGCPHFRPWLDGPHEQFLEVILDERQRDLDAGVSKEVIEANDQLILGIAQVIYLCEQQLKAAAGEAPRARRERRNGRSK